MRLRRRWITAALALLCATCLGTSCDEVIPLDLTFTGTFFSDRIRADLDPLTVPQRTENLVAYSNGTGGRLLSTLYPDGLDPERLGQLRSSEVLWSPTGTVRLSWEAQFHEVRFNGERPVLTAGPYSTRIPANPIQTKRLTMSTRGGTQPVTREFLAWRDVVLEPSLYNQFLLLSATGPLTVALEKCVGGAGVDHPDSPPVGLASSCSLLDVTPERCDEAGSFTLLPWTVLKCRIQFLHDTSLRLHVATRPGPTPLPSGVAGHAFERPLDVRPHLKVVGNERRLVRRVEFVREDCQMRTGGGVAPCDAAHLAEIERARACRSQTDLARGEWCPTQFLSDLPGAHVPHEFDHLRSEWILEPPVLEDGRLLENFVPGLAIRRIRVLRRDPDGSQQFLLASQLRRIRFEAVVGTEVESVRCRLPVGSSGVAEVIVARDCAFQGAVTPTWAAGLVDIQTGLDALLQWRLGLEVRARDGVVIGGLVTGPGTSEALVANGALVEDLPALAGDSLFLESLLEAE